MNSLMLTLLLWVVIGIQAASAQYQVTDIPKIQETTINELSETEELEPFLDGLINGLLKSHHLAGATVSIVNADSILFAKGYGYADLEKRKPVNADQTLFRIASISKLFVWTAVMQLAEQGKLDLDADINQYLGDFQIPDTFDKPITLKNLMTHTPGFEEWTIHLLAQDTSELIPLEESVKKYRPERVRPPGHITAYSNYGTGLAAYIVQQVSGQPFEAYVKKYIWAPLQMNRTTYQQPLPNRLRDDLARGYQYQNGIFKEMPDRYFIMAPMGTASSTATDMARLMMPFLNEGRYNSTSILDSTSVRTMLSPLYEPASGVSPMAYGFMVERYAGNDAIGHGGAIWEYYSLLLMLPKENVGFFISFNSDNGRAALADFAEAFISRYFDKNTTDNSLATSTANVSPDSLARFAGVYQRARRSYSTLAKISALSLSVDVSITQDSLLKTEGQQTTLWAATDHPSTFREIDGRGILSFKDGADGNPAYLYFGNVSYMAYDRAGFWNLPVVNNLFFLFAGLLFLGTIIFWPAAAHIRQRSTNSHPELLPKAAYWTGWANALVLLVFIIGLFILLTSPDPIIYGIGNGLKVLLLIPFIGIILTLVTLYFTVRMWITAKGTLLRRIYYTLLTSVFIILLLLFHHWNLIGFNY